MTLDEIAETIQKVLDEKEAVREVAIKASRTIVRQCSSAIQLIHKGEDPTEAIEAAREELERLQGIIAEHPEMNYSGFVDTAYQEYVEVTVLQAVAEGDELPGPDELGVTPQSYIEGIGDVVGELRRFALDAIIEGRVEKAREHLAMMDEIYTFLMRFDYPAALSGVKRKQDVARSLVEKTRGDVTVAARAHALERRIHEHQERMER